MSQFLLATEKLKSGAADEEQRKRVATAAAQYAQYTNFYAQYFSKANQPPPPPNTTDAAAQPLPAYPYPPASQPPATSQAYDYAGYYATPQVSAAQPQLQPQPQPVQVNPAYGYADHVQRAYQNQPPPQPTQPTPSDQYSYKPPLKYTPQAQAPQVAEQPHQSSPPHIGPQRPAPQPLFPNSPAKPVGTNYYSPEDPAQPAYPVHNKAHFPPAYPPQRIHEEAPSCNFEPVGYKRARWGPESAQPAPMSEAPVPAVVATQPLQFYRRPLPESCTDFSSAAGKEMFKRALFADTAEIYFKLSSQFRTQDEPAFCGLSTMVMVLNALSVDPGRVWKGPWRWYHESMLDCCAPLEQMKESGITLKQFLCIAQCNGLEHFTVHVNDDIKPDGIGRFRALLKETVTKDDRVMVVTYDRKSVGQTGSGHFSPVAAFDGDTDMVLILDTARFKYPPHWVPVESLYAAMRTKDAATGASRGFTVLSLPDAATLNYYKLSAVAVMGRDPESRLAINRFENWLKESFMNSRGDSVLAKAFEHAQALAALLSLRNPNCCSRNDDPILDQEDETCIKACCANVSTDMQKLKDFVVLGRLGREEGARVPLNGVAVVVGWPYAERNFRQGSNGSAMQTLMGERFDHFSMTTKNEMLALRSQIFICLNAKA